MPELLLVVVVAWLAGLAAYVGGVLAHFELTAETRGKDELVRGIVAFGGGVLLAAVAFALVPEGLKRLEPGPLVLLFVLGGATFCLLDAWIARSGGSRAQFMAMLIDFVPEAISLGAVFGHHRATGMLLAAFIALQNLPEGFNSYREIVSAGGRSRSALRALLAVSALGPAAACLGYLMLQEIPRATAGIMTFAAGGIVYLIFQDIAPQARLRRHWTPPLGAVLGFALGIFARHVIQ